MLSIQISVATDDQLVEYDKMMIECALEVERFSEIAAAVWTAVLKELERRGKVTLVSGSYDRIGDALIQRHW